MRWDSEWQQAKQIKITLKKSLITQPQNQRKVVWSLGLHKISNTVLHQNSPQIRGMVYKVRHLVEVNPAD